MISRIPSPHQEALWCRLCIWRSCRTLARARMGALLGQYCSCKRLSMRSACWQGIAAFSHADGFLSEVPQALVMCPPDFFPLLPGTSWCNCLRKERYWYPATGTSSCLVPCSAPAQEAFPFFEERSHPRLWRMFGSACLQQQALGLAVHAFVACQDFVVHPEH